MTEDNVPPIPRMGPAQEYDTLRQELLEAKRFVFERPLAITALAAACAQFLDKPLHVVLPMAIALLTLFNYWFTVNRLQSASRIVAYIHLVLEPSATRPWVGWETSLRQYRKWLSGMRGQQAVEYVDANVDPSAAPDALMYYPPIYFFHAALMIAAAFAGLVQLVQEPTLSARALSMVPLGLGLWSTVYFRRWRPSRLRLSIERNRVIWAAALKDIQTKAQA